MSSMTQFMLWLEEHYPDYQPGERVTGEMFNRYYEEIQKPKEKEEGADDFK